MSVLLACGLIMASIVGNSGFEDDNDWIYRHGAERSMEEPYAGRYSAKMFASPFFSLAEIEQIDLELSTGKSYTITLVAIPVGLTSPLIVEFDNGSGSYSIVATQTNAATGWNVIQVTVNAVGDVGRIQLSSNAVTLTAGWYVDEVTVRNVVGTTNDFYEALKTDLGTVTDLNVYGEPTDPMSAALPAAIVSQHEGGAEPDEISTLSGHAEQEFGVKLVVQSATPHETMQDLLDEVRNAIEPRGGTLNAAGTGVELAVVASWGEMVTSDDVHNLRAMIDGSVLIRYTYKLGQL